MSQPFLFNEKPREKTPDITYNDLKFAEVQR